MKNILLILLLTTAQTVFAAEAAKPSLDDELKELNLPDNVAPSGVSKEAFYSVQNRYTDLKNKFELELGGDHNFRGSSYLNMNQLGLTARFHFNNRWNVSASAAYGFNQFTGDAKLLFQKEQMLPDVSFVKERANVLLGYHPFYGKFRLSMDQVLYFDQYIAVGPGLVRSQLDDYVAAVAQVGFVFWFGHHWSTRVGLDNEFFSEKINSKSEFTYHALGHLSIGYVFGGGSI